MAFLSKYTLSFAAMALLISCGGGQTNSGQGTQAGANQSAAAQTQQTAQQPILMGKEPAGTIPEFTFYVLKSGMSFEKKDIQSARKHAFILFDPSCSHCQHEAADISKNFDKFQDVNFYFISMNDPALMSTFFERFAPKLEGKSNVHMLYDKNIDFVNKFHIPTQYPAAYIYDSKGVLQTYWNGVKNESDLINILTN